MLICERAPDENGRYGNLNEELMCNLETQEKNRRGAVTFGALLIIVPVLVLAAIAVPGSCARKTDDGLPHVASTASNQNQPAPNFDLRSLSGNRVRLSDYFGKVVVINFWATWCAPCRAEIPAFVRLREQYHDRGLEIIGVSLDEESGDAVSDFARQFHISYPVAIAALDDVEAYGPINQIPTTLIVDRQGRIDSRHLGMMSFDEIESAIKPLL
jgi:peroxiredoxin